jgi:HK97 gp10 family phage protein
LKTIDGLEELKTKLGQLTQSLYSEEAVNVYLTAARKIRDEARRQAPVSRWPIISLWRGSRGASTARRERGALRKSIVAYAYRGQAGKGIGPGAAAQVNVRWGLQRAPHAHLVEFGTASRTAKSGKVMMFPAMGGQRWIAAKRVGPTPPNPFFRRTVERAGPVALDAARDRIAKILEGTAQK